MEDHIVLGRGGDYLDLRVVIGNLRLSAFGGVSIGEGFNAGLSMDLRMTSFDFLQYLFYG